MAPKYKLHYFNLTSLGEPIRFLLSYGNLDWEDIRHDSVKWPTLKRSMPFGQMPVLYIDDKVFAQSTAISRYLAKQVGLAGEDDLENLQIDMAVDLFHDFRRKIGNWFFDPLPESQTLKEDRLFDDEIPFYLGKFEQMVTENGGYFVNEKLTWADVYFVAALRYYKFLAGKDFLVGYPGLEGLVETVESVPNIAAYIAKRPPGDK